MSGGTVPPEPDPDPDPPTPDPSGYSVETQKEYFGYYLNNVLKIDGVLVDTYETLTDGDTNSWSLRNLDDGMARKYYTPGFCVTGGYVRLDVHVNQDLYRYNGSTWVCQNGTTDPDVVDLIEGRYTNMYIDADLLALFSEGGFYL